MSLLQEFVRVTRRRPCPMCGKSSWCLISRDDPAHPRRAICKRVESQVRWGDAGCLHVLRANDVDDRRPISPRFEPFPTRVPEIDSLHQYAVAQRSERLLHTISKRLSVSVVSLVGLGMGSLHPGDLDAHGLYGVGAVVTFPMRSPEGGVVGLRLRTISGRKLAIPGSRNGLFISNGISKSIAQLLFCEGESDTAALVDLGYHVVGRPGCSSCAQLAVQLVRRLRVQDVVVVADRDEQGRQGALELGKRLRACCANVRQIEPPSGIKDARAWKIASATKADIDAVISSAPRIGISVDEQRRSEDQP